ncbi:uncharacterized protein LOC106179336 isoform X2 [Lingula anatina]|nr:uncharacterized protein LOC106179336 isoform X2 [Lingula anatina]|eukprot:XP_013418396.1 uncharacterized protein LOC106179336 isoform X2 [Lingula anatina]
MSSMLTALTRSTFSIPPQCLRMCNYRWVRTSVTTAGAPQLYTRRMRPSGSLDNNQIVNQESVRPSSSPLHQVRHLFSNSHSVPASAVCVYDGKLTQAFRNGLRYSYYPLGIMATLRLVSLLDAETEVMEVSTMLLSLFACWLPLVTYRYLKRYVTELYFEPETENFTAVTMTPFGHRKSVSFTPQDVQITKGLMTSMVLVGKRYYVEEKLIRNRAAVMALLGREEGIQTWNDGTKDRLAWQHYKTINEQFKKSR